MRAHEAWIPVRARTQELASLQFNILENSLRAQFERYMVAHAYVLKSRFQKDTELDTEQKLKERLLPNEVALLLAQRNRPAHTLQV